jgi:hypothetical protein
MATSPFRADAGLQTAQIASWQGATGVPGLYYNSTTGWMARKPDNSEIAIGGGGSLGNYTASGNNLDISVSGTMALGTGNSNTTAFTLGVSGTLGPALINCNRFRIQQGVQTGAALSALSVIGGAHTSLTASTEYLAENHQLNQSYQWLAGTTASQRHTLFQAPTYTGASATANFTNAATVAISGPPVAGTNAAITSAWALWLQTGNLGFGPNAAIGQSSASSTNTTAFSINPNVADGASSVAMVINNLATLSTAGWKLLSLRNNSTEFGSFTGSQFAAGGLRILADSTAFIDMSLNGATNIGYGSNYIGIGSGSCIFNGQGPRSDGTTTLGASGSLWPATWSKRVIQSTQNIAFSATPAFDPTAGNVIHFGPVTGNITGPTMVAGSPGERCTIVMVKDGTAGAYTVTASWGSNVRTTSSTFTTGAGSLIVLNFVWDDRLSTPAWVQMSGLGFN